MGIQNPQLISLILTFNPLSGRYESGYTPQILHVKKTGNDTTGDGSEPNPFLTINKAMSVLQNRGQIWVYEGTYAENTDTSPYVPTKLFGGATTCAISALVNGTKAHPCVLRAAPGHEGLVNITGEDNKYGIHTNNKDHWTVYGLRGIDLRTNFAGQEGFVDQHGVPIASLAQGWRFENILVKHVVGASGGNASGIGVWGSADLVIRNVKFRNIHAEGGSQAAAIQMYGTTKCLIEHIDTDDCDYGVFQKDHIDELPTAPYNPRPGAEIRYSKIKSDSYCLYYSISGDGSAASGDQYAHHNDITAYREVGANVIFAEMGGAASTSKKLRIKNNSINKMSTSGGSLFHVNRWEEFENEGNVILANGQIITTPHATGGQITKSDYNAYSQFQAILKQYTDDVVNYGNLPAWQAALASASTALGVDNPDLHSVVSATLFNNAAAEDYTLAAGSPAIGIMPDGSDAGSRQYGTEIIGLTSEYTVGD